MQLSLSIYMVFFSLQRIIFRSTNQMIVTWSETYLRTALTTAFNAVRTSPPSISVYLVEPPPVVDRPAPAARAMPRTDRERETAAATAITTTSNPSLQGNLPEVMSYSVLPVVILFLLFRIGFQSSFAMSIRSAMLLLSHPSVTPTKTACRRNDAVFISGKI